MDEDQQMYGWMRIEQIVKWVASFYSHWDSKLTDELLDILELPKIIHPNFPIAGKVSPATGDAAVAA